MCDKLEKLVVGVKCHNCSIDLGTGYFKVIRGMILCPDCRKIERELYDLGEFVFNVRKEITQLRARGGCECIVRRKRRYEEELQERIQERLYDFDERRGRVIFS